MRDYIFLAIMPLVLGFILDLILGDPPSFPHPIRFIGWLIEKGETLIRKTFPKKPGGELAGGGLLVIGILLICYFLPYIILKAAFNLHPMLYLAIETIFVYQILAVKSLRTESMKVHAQLVKGDLEGARQAVSMIVGRDTESLDEKGIIKATVETVAENTADGTVAPMIFMALGGAPLGFLYKAVNTMDSMLGYKNEKYLYFGRIAAKLDDVFNFIPARLAAVFMLKSAFFLKLDVRNGIRIFLRDRFNHASPNSAQTESVCAGVLSVELAGNAWYFGKLYEKKSIGDSLRPIEPDDIKKSCNLLYGTAWFSLVFCVVLKALISWFITLA